MGGAVGNRQGGTHREGKQEIGRKKNEWGAEGNRQGRRPMGEGRRKFAGTKMDTWERAVGNREEKMNKRGVGKQKVIGNGKDTCERAGGNLQGKMDTWRNNRKQADDGEGQRNQKNDGQIWALGNKWPDGGKTKKYERKE